jgi:hypothetical protein
MLHSHCIFTFNLTCIHLYWDRYVWGQYKEQFKRKSLVPSYIEWRCMYIIDVPHTSICTMFKVKQTKSKMFQFEQVKERSIDRWIFSRLVLTSIVTSHFDLYRSTYYAVDWNSIEHVRKRTIEIVQIWELYVRWWLLCVTLETYLDKSNSSYLSNMPTASLTIWLKEPNTMLTLSMIDNALLLLWQSFNHIHQYKFAS